MPKLASGIGKSKSYSVKSNFKHHFSLVNQRGRRIPIHIQADAENEPKKLIEEGRIRKLDSCCEQFYISPIVITVKLELDSKVLNRAVLKNKYQLNECLIDSISQEITNNTADGQPWFTTIDLKYAYSQIPLHPDTAKHCNFILVIGEATGTYRFLNGFYGLLICLQNFSKH